MRFHLRDARQAHRCANAPGMLSGASLYAPDVFA